MSSPSVVVCREVFDENSQPSVEEICEYAQQLGIDPESESHLLPLAKDGLMQALPSPWKAYYDEKLQTHYYYNDDTKKTQWEHPLDNVYRDLVKKARDASMQDDTCASVQELPTSEENTKNLERFETKAESDDELSTDSDNHTADIRENAINVQSRKLTPSGRPPLAPLTRFEKKLGELKISPLRRSVDGALSKPSLLRNPSDRDLLSRPSLERPKLLFKQQSEIIDLKMHVLGSPEEEKASLFVGGRMERGLSSSGKSNMFLKLSKSDLPSPDTDKSFPVDSVTKSDPPKGILRDKISNVPYKKTAYVPMSKPRQAASFDEDKKSVRFKLEKLPEPTTVSPGSNSSSELNDGQSSIISAPPPSSPPLNLSPVSIMSHVNPSVLLSSPVTANPSIVLSPLAPRSQPISDSSPVTVTSHVNPSIVLSPLVARPPLPPRPPDSLKSLSGSEKDSVVSESDSRDRGTSPRRRVVRPPAVDYIKQDLFQKNFQKISDLVRAGDIETTCLHLEEPVLSDKEARPRSPMIPQKSKISINLMESIESETSIDSPDREFANIDLNDFDDFHDVRDETSKEISIDNDKQESEQTIDKEKSVSSVTKGKNIESVAIPQINVPNLDSIPKSLHSDFDDDKKTSNINDLLTNASKSSPDIGSVSSTQLKISPNPSLVSDLRSPRLDFGKNWSPLSTFKPLNKAFVSPQIKSSDSATSLGRNIASPRLDGVMLSQGKSSTDNVVVVYQFENQEESYPKPIKSPLIPDMGTRDFIERNKTDERRRLELSLQKELETIRVELTAKERKMRAELQEELRTAEEKFMTEKRLRLSEMEDRHKREMEEALKTMEREHKHAIENAKLELEERFRRDTESMEKQHVDNMTLLRNDYSAKLYERRRQLELENECALNELREQLQASLSRDKSSMIEENRFTMESLREEHITRVTDLRNDYRAEVERLRAQHAWHLEELRSRHMAERATATATRDQRELADKYRCLKEKYARLKHDVKMSIERRNKRREMSMATGSETEKSNSHKTNNQSIERCKEINEIPGSGVVIEQESNLRTNNNNPIKYTDNETSQSESNAHKSIDNNNTCWKLTKHTLPSGDPSQTSLSKNQRHRKVAVAFREPPTRRRDRGRDTGTYTTCLSPTDGRNGTTTDCQDSSDATTADEKPKESVNGPGRRRCFTRLKSASTSRLNYSPKRGEGWSSPLESLRQQLRKLDDLEDQFPDLACQSAYTLPYPFAELVVPGSMATVCGADSPELEFVRHRALVEREGMRRARAVLRRRRAALRENNDTASTHRAPSEDREATELEVALHRARALLGEKEIRLRHIERALRKLTDTHPTPLIQEATTSEASSCSSETRGQVESGGAVLRSLRALHADVRDIWRALDARRTYTASPETSSCNAPTTSQTRLTLSAPEAMTQDQSEAGVAERARGLRAWLQTAP